MSKRKHISWKTKCAAAVLEMMAVRERFGLHSRRWYLDAKKMTEGEFLSLFQWDHNILHETSDPNIDEYWNLTPMLISEHREKTKQDAKLIAKSRRIRARVFNKDAAGAGNHVARLTEAPLRIDPEKVSGENWRRPSIRHFSGSHKLKSRGFDKTLHKKVDGTVVKRDE